MTRRAPRPGPGEFEVTCHGNPGLPDAAGDGGGCCMGSAVYGPDRCTCWEEVLDTTTPQAPPQRDVATPTRSGMCGDCAFRPGSPERGGDENAAYDADDLADVVTSAAFYCHDGMARVDHLRHEGTGITVRLPGQNLAYRPLRADGRLYRRDGAPAALCAGWAAHRRAEHARERQS